MSKEVLFTPEKAERFRRSMEEAKANGKVVFEFEGGEYLVLYAKYLLEYLDSQFNK